VLGLPFPKYVLDAIATGSYYTSGPAGGLFATKKDVMSHIEGLQRDRFAFGLHTPETKICKSTCLVCDTVWKQPQQLVESIGKLNQYT